jgi:hypothetical protein
MYVLHPPRELISRGSNHQLTAARVQTTKNPHSISWIRRGRSLCEKRSGDYCAVFGGEVWKRWDFDGY